MVGFDSSAEDGGGSIIKVSSKFGEFEDHIDDGRQTMEHGQTIVYRP